MLIDGGSGDGLSAVSSEAGRVVRGHVPPSPLLDALIGHTRAAILQRLEAPARAGEIAQAHYMLPGGTTYHLRHLEDAGLITRTRRGPYVIVERTARGSALLALYDPSSADT